MTELIDYMSPECSMSLETELGIVTSSELVVNNRTLSCRRCRVLNPTSRMIFFYKNKLHSLVDFTRRQRHNEIHCKINE